MRSLFRIAVLAAGVAVPAGRAPAVAVPEGRPRRHLVVIEAMAFRPATVTVAPGDTVVWVNRDIFPHTASGIPGWDSGSIGAGRTARLVPSRPGRFAYQCALHPVMKGLLIVKDSSP